MIKKNRLHKVSTSPIFFPPTGLALVYEKKYYRPDCGLRVYKYVKKTKQNPSLQAILNSGLHLTVCAVK